MFVLRVIHPANRALSKPDRAKYYYHEFDSVKALSSIFVGEIAEQDHSYGGARESQGIDGDFDVGFVLGAPVYKGQTW